MNFTDLITRANAKTAGRIDAAGAAPEEIAELKKWCARGWQAEVHEGELLPAIQRAVDAALKGETDCLFCSGAPGLRLIRSLDQYLAKVVPGEFGPLTVMQAFEVPTYPKLLWVGYTLARDAASIPDAIKGVETMVKTLAELGQPEARVALLSCVELISPGVTSTIWEATLAHMSQRGQFGKARVDGPLGFDLAISPKAVSDKGLRTDIGGEADLLIPPDLNSFSSLVDAIHLTGEHDAAGIVVGGPCPVAIPPHRSLRHVRLSLEIASLLT